MPETAQAKGTDLQEGFMNDLGVCEKEDSLLAFKPCSFQQLFHVISPLILAIPAAGTYR